MYIQIRKAYIAELCTESFTVKRQDLPYVVNGKKCYLCCNNGKVFRAAIYCKKFAINILRYPSIGWHKMSAFETKRMQASTSIYLLAHTCTHSVIHTHKHAHIYANKNTLTHKHAKIHPHKRTHIKARAHMRDTHTHASANLHSHVRTRTLGYCEER